jgi:FkbM family methyltransferase
MKGSSPKLPLAARVVRRYVRAELHHRRGGHRLLFTVLPKLRSLREIPVSVTGEFEVDVDVTRLGFHWWSWWMDGPHGTAVFEPHIQAFLTRLVRPGDVALDIGANAGFHTVLFSRLVGPEGRVFAFEPNPELLPCLRRTIEALDNATLFPCALADTDEPTTLYVPLRDHTCASLASWTDGPSREVRCHRRRLDDLVEAAEVADPDIVKIDVEGFEMLVFQGARRVLERSAPIMIFEENRSASRAAGTEQGAAKAYLAGLSAGYRFFMITRDGALRPYDDERPEWHDVLAIPARRLDHAREVLSPELSMLSPP